MSRREQRKAVVEYLTIRFPSLAELRDFCTLADIPRPEELSEGDNVAEQAIALLRHCEKLGTAAMLSLADAIRSTEGQEERKGVALEALRRLAEAPGDLPSRLSRALIKARSLCVQHGLPVLASAIALGFLLWLPGHVRSLMLSRRMTTCDAAARDDKFTRACLDVISQAAPHMRPVAAAGVVRLALHPKQETSARAALFRIAKMLDARVELPASARQAALKREFRGVPSQEELPVWTDAVVLLDPSRSAAATQLKHRLQALDLTLSTVSIDLDPTLTDGHDVLDVLLRATGARAIAGRVHGEWVAATRAFEVERMLQVPLPHFQSSADVPAVPLHDFLAAGQALEEAQSAAAGGDLAFSAERLRDASHHCGSDCTLMATLDLCTELVAIGLGRDAVVKQAIERLSSVGSAQDQYLKALGLLAWQLWKGEVTSSEAQAGDWFDPVKQAELLRTLSERDRQRLLVLAEGAKAVADLRQARLVLSWSRSIGTNTKDLFQPGPVLVPASATRQTPEQVTKALALLDSTGWKEAAFLLRTAHAPAESDEKVAAELEATLQRMSAPDVRHLLPTASLLVFPSAFYRSEALDGADWDRALSLLVKPLANITRAELQGSPPARTAQRLGMWLSMSNYIMSDEALLGEVLDALAISALADGNLDQYDLAQLTDCFMLLLPTLSQQASVADLEALLVWIEKFEGTHRKKYPVAGAAANLVLAIADLWKHEPGTAHVRSALGLSLLPAGGATDDSLASWLAPALRYVHAIALALDERADEARSALAAAQAEADKRLTTMFPDAKQKQEYHRISSGAHELASAFLDLVAKQTTNKNCVARVVELARKLDADTTSPEGLPLALSLGRLALDNLVYFSAFYLGDAGDPVLARVLQKSDADLGSVLAHLPQTKNDAIGRVARTLVAAFQTAAASSGNTDSLSLDSMLDAAQKLLDEVAPAAAVAASAAASPADRLIDLQLGAGRLAVDVFQQKRHGKIAADKLDQVLSERMVGYLAHALRDQAHDRGVLPTSLRLVQANLQSMLDNQTAAARAKFEDALDTDAVAMKAPIEIMRATLELSEGGDAKEALALAANAMKLYPEWSVPLHMVRARAYDQLRQLEPAQAELRAAAGAVQTGTRLGRTISSVAYRSPLPAPAAAGGEQPDLSSPISTLATARVAYDFLAQLQDQKPAVIQTGIGFEIGRLKEDESEAQAFPSLYSPKFARVSLLLADAVHAMARGDEQGADRGLTEAATAFRGALRATRAMPERLLELPADLVLWTAALADVHGHGVRAFELFSLANSLRSMSGDKTPLSARFKDPPWILGELPGLEEAAGLLEKVATFRMLPSQEEMQRALVADLVLSTKESGPLLPAQIVQNWARSADLVAAPGADAASKGQEAAEAVSVVLARFEREPDFVPGSLVDTLLERGFDTELARVFDVMRAREDPRLAELLEKSLPNFRSPWLLRTTVAAAIARMLRENDRPRIAALARALQSNPHGEFDDALLAATLLIIDSARSGHYEQLTESFQAVLARELQPAMRSRLKILLHAASTLTNSHPAPLSEQATLGIRVEDEENRIIADYLSAVQKDANSAEQQARQLFDRMARRLEGMRRFDVLPADPRAREAELLALGDAHAAHGSNDVRVKALGELVNLSRAANRMDDALKHLLALRETVQGDDKAQVLEVLVDTVPKAKPRAGLLEEVLQERVSFYKGRGPSYIGALVESYRKLAEFYAMEMRLPEAERSARQALALARSMPARTGAIEQVVVTFAQLRRQGSERVAALTALIAEEETGQQAEHATVAFHARMALFDTLRAENMASEAAELAWPLIEASVQRKLHSTAANIFQGAMASAHKEPSEAAFAFADRGLQLATGSASHELAYAAAMAKARLWDLSKNPPRLLEALSAARQAASRLGSKDDVWHAYVLLSDAHFKLGQRELARDEALFALETAEDETALTAILNTLWKDEGEPYHDMLLDVLSEYTNTFPRWKDDSLLPRARMLLSEILQHRQRYTDAETQLKGAEADAIEAENTTLRAEALRRMFNLRLKSSGCEEDATRCEDVLTFAAAGREQCADDREYACAYEFEDVAVTLLERTGNVEKWAAAARAQFERYPSDLKSRANYAGAMLATNRYPEVLAAARSSRLHGPCSYAVVLRGLAWSAAQLAGTEDKTYGAELLEAAEKCPSSVEWSFAQVLHALKTARGARSIDRVERMLAHLTEADVKARHHKLRSTLQI